MLQIPIEVSARHVHISAEDLVKLFGVKELEVDRPISQHGQFLAKERVTVQGPKGSFEKVAIIGPIRSRTQVELSRTDARTLGIEAPLSGSGNLEKAALVTIIGTVGTIEQYAAIIPSRHLHIGSTEADSAGLKDLQVVSVRIPGERGAVLSNVLVRTHPDFRLRLHLDTDEGNACGVQPDMVAEIVS